MADYTKWHSDFAAPGLSGPLANISPLGVLGGARLNYAADLGGVDLGGKITVLSVTPTPYEMLGGEKIIAHEPTTPVEAHDLLKDGIPTRALEYLRNHVRLLQDDRYFEVALGISPRTRQRHLAEKRERLNLEQSDRTWQFTEVLALATDVLGSQDKAEAWLAAPAMALDQRAPIDLLSTTAGVEMVKEHLVRMDYGVFA